MATLVIGGLAATSTFTTGHTAPPTRTEFVSGTVWLASFVPGQISLLDGSTGAIVDQLSGSRLPGVRPGDHIQVAQAGSGAYVADTHTGVLDRIDGATHDVISATDIVAADGAETQMYPATNHLFVVDPRRGRVTIADPLTLRASAPTLPLSAQPAATILDPQGHLWFVDMNTKQLDELNGDDIRRTSVTVNPYDRVALVLVRDRPALVDYSGTDSTGLHPSVRVIDPGPGTAGPATCLGIDPDDPLAIAGGSPSPRVWIASGSAGRLYESDLATGGCDGGTVVSPGSRRFEAPVDADGRVFLADETTGQAEVINAATLQPVAPVRQVVAPGSQFDLFSKDGIVFFNDPATQDAGIIRPDGTVVRAATYLSTGAPSPGRSGAGSPSLPSFAFVSGETGPGGVGGQFPSAGSITSPRSSPTGSLSSLTSSPSSPGAPQLRTPAGDGALGGLEITTRSLAPASVGEPYTERLTAAGGTAPYKWAASGLPRGLDLDANRGVISGLPSAPANDVVTVTVSDAADTITHAIWPLVVYPAPTTPPVISGVTPNQGPATGGNTVTVTGSHLAAARAVRFGGVAATVLTVTSDTSLSATAPAGPPGAVVDITVTNPAGTSATGITDHYTYVAPQTKTPTGPGISFPYGIAAGPDGALWFTNSGNNTIGRITTTGLVTNYTAPGIDIPWGITLGPDGALWFTNLGNNTIGRITTAGLVTSYTGPGISSPWGIRAGPDGALWFTNYGNNSIGRITTTGLVTNHTGNGINRPWGITSSGPNGAMWFTNQGNNTIGRITTTGLVTNYSGNGIDEPQGITAGANGPLWFTNYGNNSIGRITTTGVVSNYTAPGINGPWGITSGPDDGVWFTNRGNNSIGRIPTAGAEVNYFGAGIDEPEAIRTGLDQALWFTNYGNNSIGRITVTGQVTNYTGLR